MLRAMTIDVKLSVCVLCLISGSVLSRPAHAGSDPPPAPAPASPVPAPAPASPTLPPVTFTASPAPTAHGLEDTESSGPIDLFLIQDRLAGNQSDPAESPICHTINLLCTELVNSPFRTDPRWHFGLNPMVWIARTGGATSDWWKAFRALPSGNKPLFEGLPFVYDDTPVPTTASAGYRRAVERNNTALETLFIKGDIPQAAAIIETAVSADTTYPIASYNAGLLHLGRHNLVGAFASFLRCLDRRPSLEMKTRIDELSLAIKKLSALLKRDDGQSRRLISESIDTSWALAQAGQFSLARRVAGQGVVVDNEEKWPECPAIIAYCYARQGDLKSATDWLITSMERSQRAGVHERIRVTLAAVHAELQKLPPSAEPARPSPATEPPPSQLPP